MIVRPYYLDLLKTYRDVPLVKILAGIRRCGKSTILDMLKDDLLGSGIAADHVIPAALYLGRAGRQHDRQADVSGYKRKK